MNRWKRDEIINDFLVVIDDNFEKHMESGEVFNISKDICDMQEELELTKFDISRIKEYMRDAVGQDVERILYIYFRYHYEDTVLTDMYSSDTIFRLIEDANNDEFNDCIKVTSALIAGLINTLTEFQLYGPFSENEEYEDINIIYEFTIGLIENSDVFHGDSSDMCYDTDTTIVEDVIDILDTNWLYQVFDGGQEDVIGLDSIIGDCRNLLDIMKSGSNSSLFEWMDSNVMYYSDKYDEERMKRTRGEVIGMVCNVWLGYIHAVVSNTDRSEVLKLVVSKFNRHLYGVDIT